MFGQEIRNEMAHSDFDWPLAATGRALSAMRMAYDGDCTRRHNARVAER
jgi:hypothetical protein